VTRGLRAAAALVLVLTAGAAFAFVRSTTTPGQPGGGVCLWWNTTQLRYQVNAAGNGGTGPAVPCRDAAAAADAVATSLPAWGQSCTAFRFVDGGTTTRTSVGNDGVNLVVFRAGRCSDTALVPADAPCRGTPGACATLYNCWEHAAALGGIGTLALTTSTFDLDTGEILDADVEVHGWDGDLSPAYGAYLTCELPGSPVCGAPRYGQLGCTWNDVGTLVLHEAGHVLGLDHVCAYPEPYDACPDGSIMAPLGSGGTVQRVIGADDAAGICTIYPVGGPTLKCVEERDTERGGGCSAGAGDSGGSAGRGVALALGALLVSRGLGRRRAVERASLAPATVPRRRGSAPTPRSGP
jgi:hypothetical protein